MNNDLIGKVVKVSKDSITCSGRTLMGKAFKDIDNQ